MAPPSEPPVGRVAALALATPATRNRYIDLVRAWSILVVVVGHWLMAVISYRAGAIIGDHLLVVAPWVQLLTWVLQVMPLFFIVGGYANAASWTSAEARGTGYLEWLRGRAARLLRPTVVFVAVWLVAVVIARTAGLEPGLLETGAHLVAVPLWFLAVYLVVVAFAPLLLRAHRRAGFRVVLALAAGALVVDVLAHVVRVPFVGWLNFAVVWLAVHQLGYLWHDGTLRRRVSTRWWLAAGGLAGLGVLALFGPYPVSMVGVPDAARSNNTPPTFALVALACWQAGLAVALQDAGNRWLTRRRAWQAVVAANGMIMTVYLWHLTAMVLVIVAVYPTGVWPDLAPASASWWLWRPVWLVLLAAVLVPLVVLFGWAERSLAPPPALGSHWGGHWALPRAVGGAAAVVAALGAFAWDGFFAATRPYGLPWPALVALAVGVALLRPGLPGFSTRK
jgi:fucose 4-O-acetylase-like acetyltransferase